MVVDRREKLTQLAWHRPRSRCSARTAATATCAAIELRGPGAKGSPAGLLTIPPSIAGRHSSGTDRASGRPIKAIKHSRGAGPRDRLRSCHRTRDRRRRAMEPSFRTQTGFAVMASGMRSANSRPLEQVAGMLLPGPLLHPVADSARWRLAAEPPYYFARRDTA